MSRAAAFRLAVLAGIGASIAVLVRALRGDPAPVFTAPTGHHGLLAPCPPPATTSTLEPATDPIIEPVIDPVIEPAADPGIDRSAAEAPSPTAPTAPTAPEPKPSPPGARWAFPVDGECPPGHPIKAKLRSGIYHLPGMMAYDRARPDRCYATEVDAEADGLRRAKR